MTLHDISRIVTASRALAEEFKRQGLHVGWGVQPVCVTCNVPWPCADAEPSKLDTPCESDTVYDHDQDRGAIDGGSP